MPAVNTIAIIGSFRQHYAKIQEAWRFFTENGVVVTSPKGTAMIKEGIPFVRFTSDHDRWDDPMVQTVALHRILRGDLTYVMAPEGYVGRTTCYEIGRIVQARRPLYFSEMPQDLPVRIPEEHVCHPAALLDRIRSADFLPQILPGLGGTDLRSVLERELLEGRYRHDEDIPK